MHNAHESRPARWSYSNSGVARSLATAALVAVGVLVGNALSSSPDTRRDFARVVVEPPTPPVLAVPNAGFAVVGACDNRYYVVTPDGHATLIRDGRLDLCWR